MKADECILQSVQGLSGTDPGVALNQRKLFLAYGWARACPRKGSSHGEG